MGAREQPLAPRWKMQGRSPQPSMELNRLLLLTSFLLHIKEDRASPTRLVCDNRLIQKYIMEAKDMETRVGQCQALPVLSCPAVLPLVDFTFQQWKSKLVRGAGRRVLALVCQQDWRRNLGLAQAPEMLNKMLVGISGGTGRVEDPIQPQGGQRKQRGPGDHCLLPQNETKRREILCDLALLVGAVAGAQGQVSEECGAKQLSQLYRHANSFFLLLQTFSWEGGHWEPSCSPHSMEQTHVTSIFLTYRQLVQGKLLFFFEDLAKVLCKQGQGDSKDPPYEAR
ncbi:thrombopoietin isoform X1 [Corvus moneduloides]|uniref:thrombopoietin isoform X1 n=1 Tax=Corvus moneduloides TaxID=1196302 RepID=UPI001363FDF6|nr:thrombopoietin isoform X1 [Corvus moneduloides]